MFKRRAGFFILNATICTTIYDAEARNAKRKNQIFAFKQIYRLKRKQIFAFAFPKRETQTRKRKFGKIAYTLINLYKLIS